MCGIVGYLGPAELPFDAASLRGMRDVLAHRGPDGDGELEIAGEANGCALRGWLGHRRLKVIDLTENAAQPMTNEDGSVAVLHNGEVYNFRELRRELAARGFRFRSSGDTEVVLRAYEAWGEGFVERIDGMFAVAVWDRQAAKLVLARDRLGEKPLFYALVDRRLVFASEIKGLLASPWLDAAPDFTRLAELMTYGYVPYPATLFRHVQQVPPASYVVYEPAGLREPHEYWSPLPQTLDLRPSAEVFREIGQLVRAATERRMIADVPLGAFLSGGVDSSVVVGLMAQASPEPVHTFSVGFPEEPSFDERPHARTVARHFRTRHTEFAVRIDAVGLLDALVWHHDQPFADSSAIPTYLVAKLAREHVTVALNGDGGDEVFAGYERFAAAAAAEAIPAPLVAVAARVGRLLPDGAGYFNVRRRIERFTAQGDAPLPERYYRWTSVVSPDVVASLLGPSLAYLADRVRLREPLEVHCRRASHLPVLDRLVYANLKTYLPDDLAVKMDRATMANSLEARSPFLDTALIEYVSRLPARQRIGLYRIKPALRRSLFPLLPRSIWNRRKHGFGVPVATWFRSSELADLFVDEVLGRDARTDAVLNREAVVRLWREHREGKSEHGSFLWTLLTLERWLRLLERPGATRPSAELRDAVHIA